MPAVPKPKPTSKTDKGDKKLPPWMKDKPSKK
jgi:hypothetical protein